MAETRENVKLYWTWKKCLTRVLHTQRVHATGLQHIPLQGSGILVSNHLNWKDVLFIAARAPRPIHYVATDQLFNVDMCTEMAYQYVQEKLGPRLAPLTRRWCATFARRIVPAIPKIGTIPTTRKNLDKRLFEGLKDALRTGKLVCIFAEGGTSIPGKIRKFKKIAAKVIYDLYNEGFTDIPVIPTLVMGTNKIFLLGRRLDLHCAPPLYIGEHLLSDGKQTVVQFTQMVEDSVRRLLNRINTKD